MFLIRQLYCLHTGVHVCFKVKSNSAVFPVTLGKDFSWGRKACREGLKVLAARGAHVDMGKPVRPI